MTNIEVYRVKKGQLTSNEICIPFDFGIIFSNDGLLSADFYIEESFELSEFIEANEMQNWYREYIATCITEEKNELEIDNLSFTNVNPNFSKVNMVCYGKMKHTKISQHKKKVTENNPELHYLEIEGLKMEFSDITEQIRARKGEKIKDFNYWHRDHTATILVSTNSHYNQLFYSSEDSKNTIVEFPKESNSILSYNRFLELKNNYISVLSFLNGAEIRIRKECTGSFYSIDKIDSEIVITYSFQTILNSRYNNYIPLNKLAFRSEYILRKFFNSNFDNYCNWNEKIDLNTIVFYLSSSEQTKSIEEKVFIQMIAFERITTMYAEYLGEKEEFIPSNEEFEPIKKELIKIIESHKEKFGSAYNTVKSKIGNVNQIKRLSTSEKMYRIINDCGLPIDNRIECLINKVRNKTIHRGEIGAGNEAIVNFQLLDELIREIILRLVKYDGLRVSKILL